METLEKYKTIFVIGVFILFVIYSSSLNPANTKENMRKKVISIMMKNEFSGVITEKHIEPNNHNRHIIKLNNKRIAIYDIVYETASVGDSINKVRGTNILYVFKKNRIIKIDLIKGTANVTN